MTGFQATIKTHLLFRSQPLLLLVLLGMNLAWGSAKANANQPAWEEWAIQSGQIATQSTATDLRLELNLTRRRVTLYLGNQPLSSYPVAVGKPGWETPVGEFTIKEMIRDPDWANPFDGRIMRAGHPRNPLGRRWIGFWTDGKDWIGFHGTPDPQYVGQAVSHGCVRMKNQDIEELFEKVALGTPVKVVR